ncbi:hypothetical protein [Spirulina subsalsa]|uniref:hypothetical protein n=1 Tax=Spirulina subsalsa TaxID=54311 RepID=UPI0002FBE396|nr:hypothetical protein [Spirulina subsalsa]
METKINCAEACVNGCVLGDQCPNREYVKQASDFMETTSLDQMLEIAEAARLKKLSEPTQWVIPDEI